MKKMLFAFSMAGLFLLSACSRPAAEETETAEMTAAAESTQETSGVLVIEDAGEDKNKTISVRIVDSSNPALPGREAKKVRGIYITGPVAGNEEVVSTGRIRNPEIRMQSLCTKIRFGDYRRGL